MPKEHQTIVQYIQSLTYNWRLYMKKIKRIQQQNKTILNMKSLLIKMQIMQSWILVLK